MIECAVSDGSPGGPNGERSALELSSRPVSVLGCLVDDLVEGGEDIVAELDLGYRGVSGHCQPDRESDDALLGQRRVEHPVHSVPLAQA